MTIPTYGHIILTPVSTPGASVTMTTDPDTIAQTWMPRKSTEQGLEGSVTTQDWGLYAVDCYRTLSWTNGGQYLDKNVILQLRLWLMDRGSTYRYEDGEGNDWTVEFLGMKETREFGQPLLWRCALDLHVISMQSLLGQPYTGN